MSKAYIFPGQGSQFPGMGKALYERSAEAREMMDRANEILGFPITDIMFGEDAEALKATRVTQPAIFIHSVVLARCSGLEAPSMVAGHSLGEFSALVAAGAMDFEDGLRLVAVRASAMQKCCEQVPGTMAAVIKLPTETVEDQLQQRRTDRHLRRGRGRRRSLREDEGSRRQARPPACGQRRLPLPADGAGPAGTG